MQDVKSDQRTDRGVSSKYITLCLVIIIISNVFIYSLEGQAGNIRAKFENMAVSNPEVS